MVKSKKRADAGYLELMISLIISLALGLALIIGSKGIMRGTEGTNLIHQLHNELTTQVVNAPFQREYDTDNLVKIYLDYDSINLYVTQKKQITYALKGPDNCDKTVTWESLNSNIASVDSNGIVTGVSPGDTVVYATTSTKVRAKCSVHVDPQVTITFDTTELNLRVGAVTDYAQIKYTLNPSNPVNKLVTWSSSNTNIASVDNKGYVTPKQPGDSVITGKTYTGNYAQCKVHVTRVWKLSLISDGNGSVSGSGIYPEGSNVKIVATPKDGYKFSQWSDGNTSATRLISVTQNINLTAYFETDEVVTGYTHNEDSYWAVNSHCFVNDDGSFGISAVFDEEDSANIGGELKLVFSQAISISKDNARILYLPASYYNKGIDYQTDHTYLYITIKSDSGSSFSYGRSSCVYPWNTEMILYNKGGLSNIKSIEFRWEISSEGRHHNEQYFYWKALSGGIVGNTKQFTISKIINGGEY